MKKLTENQQNIIDNIRSEFERINASAKPKGKFNLVDVSELNRINEEIAENKRIELRDADTWNSIARTEAERIVYLLSGDLPDYVSFTIDNVSWGHLKHIRIIINTPQNGCVSFKVMISTRYEQLTHGCDYQKGIGLVYCYGSDFYASVEDLFEQSSIKEAIRKRI